MRIPLILVLACFVSLVACEPSSTITGFAEVVDGDGLEISGTTIRLHAIDAPEYRQACLRDGTVWACGVEATKKMRQLVEGHVVNCVQTDMDQYGRTVARCSNGETDLGAAMVLTGLALAYRQFGQDYVEQEAIAERSRAGIWAGEFTPPWEWRRNPVNPVSRATATADSGDCLIKGNINRDRERIYHVPGSSSYAQTRIDESRGERWFCSEQEALDAGWRAPRGQGR